MEAWQQRSPVHHITGRSACNSSIHLAFYSNCAQNGNILKSMIDYVQNDTFSEQKSLNRIRIHSDRACIERALAVMDRLCY